MQIFLNPQPLLAQWFVKWLTDNIHKNKSGSGMDKIVIHPFLHVQKAFLLIVIYIIHIYVLISCFFAKKQQEGFVH